MGSTIHMQTETVLEYFSILHRWTEEMNALAERVQADGQTLNGSWSGPSAEPFAARLREVSRQMQQTLQRVLELNLRLPRGGGMAGG